MKQMNARIMIVLLITTTHSTNTIWGMVLTLFSNPRSRYRTKDYIVRAHRSRSPISSGSVRQLNRPSNQFHYLGPRKLASLGEWARHSTVLIFQNVAIHGSNTSLIQFASTHPIPPNPNHPKQPPPHERSPSSVFTSSVCLALPFSISLQLLQPRPRSRFPKLCQVFSAATQVFVCVFDPSYSRYDSYSAPGAPVIYSHPPVTSWVFVLSAGWGEQIHESGKHKVCSAYPVLSQIRTSLALITNFIEGFAISSPQRVVGRNYTLPIPSSLPPYPAV